jgi:hypothetical protein
MEIDEPLMECNFPELLAGDLGRSEDVFLSKNLTAGAPVPLLVDDGSKRRYSLQDSSTRYFSSHSRDILCRMKSLQTIDQKYVLAMAENYDGPRKSSDTTTTESSGGMEPPSVATHDISVTAATSVTSGRFSPSDKAPSPVDKRPFYSWMDLDLEENPNFDRSYTMGYTNQAAVPIGRRGGLGNLRSMSMDSKLPHVAGPNPFSAFSSPTKSSAAAMESPRSLTFPKRLAQPINIPKRRSSLGQTDQPTLSYDRNAPYSAPLPGHYSPGVDVNVTPTTPPPPSPKGLMPPNDEKALSMLSLESDSDMELPPLMARKPTASRVVSPLLGVEQWLESNIDIGFSNYPQPGPDSTTSRIPIPPEVLETLRITVACFPETMLLCSSLSIETIRSHSKQVRYRASNPYGDSQVSLSITDGSPRSSKWKWLTTKRSPGSRPTKPQSRQGACLEPPTLTTGSRAGTSDWSTLKNLFPAGSDYLCDALYAHLLAYNYITRLCPRSAIVNSNPRRSSISSIDYPASPSAKSNASDSNKIPRKAASILGLQNNISTIPPPPEAPKSGSRTSTLRNKASFIMGRRAESVGCFNHAANRPVDDYEKSLGDLRLGLAKCVARLVATLRQTGNNGAQERASTGPVEVNDVDPLFVRALCEIVQCCEERS